MYRATPKIATLKKEKPPQFTGWLSTDEDEIKRRKWRGRTEITEVNVIDEEFWPYCDYQVVSESGNTYTVEWRSAIDRINTCECKDFLTNRLGTCKHIEGVNEFLSKNRSSNYRKQKNPRAEIFLDESNSRLLRPSHPENGLVLPSPLQARIDYYMNILQEGNFFL